MTLTALQYGWVQGRSRSVPAEVVASVVSDIETREGTCPPERLVTEASKKGSPLHQLFTWNDTEAARLWRTHEARRVINSIEIIESDGTAAPAFVSVMIAEGRRGYVSVISLATDEDLQEWALAEVRKTLNGWRRRYRHLTDLWDAFDEVIDN